MINYNFSNIEGNGAYLLSYHYIVLKRKPLIILEKSLPIFNIVKLITARLIFLSNLLELKFYY